MLKIDIQLKKGMLDVCVLAVIKKEPSYGYKIVTDVSECIDISESTLYPILRRLENTGCLVTYTSQLGGRVRKYYRITELGIRKISDFLADWKQLENIYNFIKNHGGASNEPNGIQ